MIKEKLSFMMNYLKFPRGGMRGESLRESAWEATSIASCICRFFDFISLGGCSLGTFAVTVTR